MIGAIGTHVLMQSKTLRVARGGPSFGLGASRLRSEASQRVRRYMPTVGALKAQSPAGTAVTVEASLVCARNPARRVRPTPS